MEVRKKENPVLLQLVKVVLVMYIITGLLLVLLAFITEKSAREDMVVNIGVIVIYVVSSGIGGLILGKMRGVRKFLWGMLAGCIYFAIMAAVSLALSTQGEIDLIHMVTAFSICAGAGMAGGMIG